MLSLALSPASVAMFASVSLRSIMAGIDGLAAWYDISDRATLFQDAAGTIPVTAAGDPVGLVLDKSGAGRHLTAPSDSARPVYQTDGTRHWLEFDGVDDEFTVASRFGLSANPSLLVASGVRPSAYTADTQRIWHLGGSGSGGTISGALGTNGLSWRHNDGNRIFSAVPAGSDYVISHTRQSGDAYGDQLAFVDSVLQVESSVGNPSGTPTNTTSQFYVGSQGDANFLGMRLYVMVILGDHTSAERKQLEGWVAAKSGVSL